MGRMTISIDSKLENVLREVQCAFIRTDKKSWSMSKIFNMLVASAVVNPNSMSMNDWNKIKAYLNGSKLGLDDVQIDEFVGHLIDFKKIEKL